MLPLLESEALFLGRLILRYAHNRYKISNSPPFRYSLLFTTFNAVEEGSLDTAPPAEKGESTAIDYLKFNMGEADVRKNGVKTFRLRCHNFWK